MPDGFLLPEVLKEPPLFVNQWGTRMNKRIYICAAVILIFSVLALLAYNYLEIYTEKTYSRPSREVRSNDYYAMERWLKETGHSVRFENQFYPELLTTVTERVVMIHSSVSRWDDADEFILPWIKQGGYLIISMDYFEIAFDENLLEFLSGVGITVEQGIPGETVPDESIPDFDKSISFLFEDKDEILSIRDTLGYARLAEISIGDGALAVIGNPLFMNNNNLKKNINAGMAWNLTGARIKGDNTGILFFRNHTEIKSMFGKIIERGNLASVGISAFIVIFLGFWMVIPVFGLVFDEKQRSSRPIKERFDAEISFLKKYRALDYYLEIYERELQLEHEPQFEREPQFANNTEMKKSYRYRKLINKLRSVYNGTDKFKRGIGGIKTGTGKE
jgi:hypothetical protein